MNFQEIPQYTRGNYEVDVSLDYLKNHLERFAESYGLNLNPDFQRGVVWGEDRQVKFIEHLLRGGTNAKVIYFNSPIWGGNYKNPDCDLKEEVICVDGLQRLTSCLRFMDNEIKAFGYYFNEFEGRLPFHVGLKFNINDLQTKEQVLKWYLEMNEGLMVHSESELNRVRELLSEIKKKGE